MTQRSVLTTQSKLTVQAPTMKSGVPAKLAILQEGLIRAKTVSSGSVGGSAHPCALPRVWGRSLERKFASLLT
ncbi:hypothetical protein JCM17380_43820 [Desulfosporosinus burensis]